MSLNLLIRSLNARSNNTFKYLFALIPIYRPNKKNETEATEVDIQGKKEKKLRKSGSVPLENFVKRKQQQKNSTPLRSVSGF